MKSRSTRAHRADAATARTSSPDAESPACNETEHDHDRRHQLVEVLASALFQRLLAPGRGESSMPRARARDAETENAAPTSSPTRERT